MIDNEIIEKITKRGVKEIISETEFVNLLQSGKKLRLKMGFDPSRADIHLGHVVGLRKLKQLQDLGHEVILIVGDWTAQIGDPSGQSVTRPMLTHDDVIRYFMTIKEASQLVIQASALGKGGDVFLLDMGEPIKIKELAKKMIRLSGLTIKDKSGG